ncbi:MAG: GtrA family protein, partial [Candidatus Paceibacterales bacterium]
MQKSDFVQTAVVSVAIVLFLLPTLILTGLYYKIPFMPVSLFITIPVVSIIGMVIANMLGKKITILWQFAKFALVGVLNTAIDFGVLNSLIIMTKIASGIGIIPLNIISFSAATANSYYWNKKWVFGVNKSSFIVFIAVTLIGLGMNTGVVYVLTTFVPPMFVSSEALWANFAKVLATVLSLIWNFVGYRLVV